MGSNWAAGHLQLQQAKSAVGGDGRGGQPVAVDGWNATWSMYITDVDWSEEKLRIHWTKLLDEGQIHLLLFHSTAQESEPLSTFGIL